MGSSQSRNDHPLGEIDPPPRQSLSQLLEENPVDWDACAMSLEACPEQALLYAHGGIEPSLVWRAIQKGAPEDLVKRLLECDPDALDQVSHRGGSTLLHLAAAVGTHSSPQAIRLLLQHRPNLASVPDHQGRLPLHRCSDGVGDDATAGACAAILLNAFPQGLSRRSRTSGSLPLHYALEPQRGSIVSANLVRVLTSPPPSNTTTTTPSILSNIMAKTIRSRDKFGRTPLQLLLQRLRQPQQQDSQQNHHLDDDLWNILQDWIARFLSRPGSPRLHTCIEIGGCQTLSMMQRALQDYQDSDLHDWDALGRSPLHLAGLNGQCDADALACLLDANPKAPRMTDHEGRLPIDIAAESSDTQPHCLALLIRGEPRAVNTRDLRNGYYPFLTSALSQSSSLDNTYYLLRSRPEVLSYCHAP